MIVDAKSGWRKSEFRAAAKAGDPRRSHDRSGIDDRRRTLFRLHAGGCLCRVCAVGVPVPGCGTGLRECPFQRPIGGTVPTSGGTYAYGREVLGPWPGFIAGWGFVVGKTASAAAMALTFATYAVPESWVKPVGRWGRCAARRSQLSGGHPDGGSRTSHRDVGARTPGDCGDRDPRRQPKMVRRPWRAGIRACSGYFRALDCSFLPSRDTHASQPWAKRCETPRRQYLEPSG